LISGISTNGSRLTPPPMSTRMSGPAMPTFGATAVASAMTTTAMMTTTRASTSRWT
jgi:hypothetical protein